MKNRIVWLVLLLVVLLGFWWYSSPSYPTPVPSYGDAATSTAAAPVPTGSVPAKKPAVKPAEKGITLVTYTDNGFAPFVVEVKLGQAVRFVNQSSHPLWVTGYLDPNSPDHLYDELDEGKSIARGQSYTFNFLKKGLWGYKNLNKSDDRGGVAVN